MILCTLTKFVTFLKIWRVSLEKLRLSLLSQFWNIFSYTFIIFKVRDLSFLIYVTDIMVREFFSSVKLYILLILCHLRGNGVFLVLEPILVNLDNLGTRDPKFRLNHIKRWKIWSSFYIHKVYLKRKHCKCFVCI